MTTAVEIVCFWGLPCSVHLFHEKQLSKQSKYEQSYTTEYKVHSDGDVSSKTKLLELSGWETGTVFKLFSIGSIN